MARILLAEDERSTRAHVAGLARKLGHDVIQSSNGRRAWEFLEDNPDVALLITDMVMPEMDGLELIARLRADSRFEALPVLVISAYAGVREVARLLEEGASAFLPKPLDPTALSEYIERYIGSIRLTSQ